MGSTGLHWVLLGWIGWGFNEIDRVVRGLWLVSASVLFGPGR